MPRRILDMIYQGAAGVAAACLAAIALLILAQAVGRWFGIMIPSAGDFAGFLLAAATFLALPQTLRHGQHIRVSLLSSRLSPRARRRMEVMILLVALFFSTWATWACASLVHDSWRFEDVSTGFVPIPLWIPQAPLAAGFALFALSLADDLVCLLCGGMPGIADGGTDADADAFKAVSGQH